MSSKNYEEASYMVIENVFQWQKFFLEIRGGYLTWGCSFLFHLVISQNSPDFLFISFAFSYKQISLRPHISLSNIFNERTNQKMKTNLFRTEYRQKERTNEHYLLMQSYKYCNSSSTELCFIDFLNIETWWLFDYNKMRDV